MTSVLAKAIIRIHFLGRCCVFFPGGGTAVQFNHINQKLKTTLFPRLTRCRPNGTKRYWPLARHGVLQTTTDAREHH